MTEAQWELFGQKLDQLLQLATEMRDERRQERAAEKAAGATGTMAAPETATTFSGYVTPISEKDGANIRAAASTASNKAGSLAYGKQLPTLGNVSAKSENGQEFLWHLVADGFIRADVVMFSPNPFAFPPAATGLYPCPTKYESFTSGGFNPPAHLGWDLATSDGHKGEPIFTGPLGAYVMEAAYCKKCGQEGKSNTGASVLNDEAWGYGFGHHVVLRYSYDQLPLSLKRDLPQGSYVFVMHAHMQTISVAENASLIGGEQIGTMGSSGNSSGAHLHLEVRASLNAWSTFYRATLLDPANLYSRTSR